MPLSKYFGGKGEKVMKAMKSEYGDTKGTSVFYATANKRKQKPKAKKSAMKSPTRKAPRMEMPPTGGMSIGMR